MPRMIKIGLVLGFTGITVGLAGCDSSTASDPRTQDQLVRVAEAKPANQIERGFTGFVAARVQSNLTFRVAGKVTARLVDAGQTVRSGQPLMRIDRTDYEHAIAAQRGNASAAKARLMQAAADEARYQSLVTSGAVSKSAYDQAKAAADSARALFEAAEAQVRVAENEGKYATLVADADGVVMETLAEQGQFVAAGQVVMRLAQAGPREAAVYLPETLRPAIGSVAEAVLYGAEGRNPARLRQISDTADPVTRTFEARYVLEGMAASGKNFDRITLGSLILALGLLVDDAIIAIEMMVVKMEEGYDRIAASAYAWSHTAAPMLSGTLVTAIGFMPNGFARSSAGEYTSNMFWIVGIALIMSWIVAVVFTPYLGVKLLPDIKKAEGGHGAIYNTQLYNRFRRVLGQIIARKWLVAGAVVGVFVVAVLGMGVVRKQFFPTSDRPEVLIEVQMPYGTSIEQTSAATAKVEAWLAQQEEAKIVTAYVGQGAPRFYLAMSPELPDPSFAKIWTCPERVESVFRIMRLRPRSGMGFCIPGRNVA